MVFEFVLFAFIAYGLLLGAIVIGLGLVMVALAYGGRAVVQATDALLDFGEFLWPYIAPVALPVWRFLRFCSRVVAWVRHLAAPFLKYRVIRFGFRFAVICALIIIPSACWLGWYFYLDGSDVPDANVILQWRPSQIGYVYDRNGLVTVRLATAYRETIASEYIPEQVRQALVSAEDKRFWDHHGWDPTATVRAAAKSVSTPIVRFRRQGASTITQQVARNIYLEEWLLEQWGTKLLVDSTPTRMLSFVKGPIWTNNAVRKVREIKYAIRLERALTDHFEHTRRPSHGFREWLSYDLLGLYDGRHDAKEFLLGSYANLVYLGHGVYGMSYGARFYFGKSMEQLTADEAAFLASIISFPARYGVLDANPGLRQEQIERRNAVLDRMAANGYLDAARLVILKHRPLVLTPPRLRTKTNEPAVVELALEELHRLGYTQQDILNGRIRMHLTADRNIQAIVNAAALDGIYGTEEPMMPGYAGKYRSQPEQLPQIAVVVLKNSDAQILALFGGIYDEKWANNYTLFNRATHAVRQPGSTFKGIDALAAVTAGVQLDDLVFDGPLSLNMGGWNKPIHNYDGRYEGWIPFREAFAQSRNVPIMRLMRERSDIDSTIAWARTLGITAPLERMPSTFLGASGVTLLEMTNAYRALISGIVATPTVVAAITDPDGTAHYTFRDTAHPLDVPPEQLASVQELLRSTVRLPRGTAHALDTSNFPIQVLGKTGTSNDYRDAWFIGAPYGPNGITVGVWVGHDDGQPMADKTTGGGVALPVARNIFLALYGPGGLLGDPPRVPAPIEQRIDAYIVNKYPERLNK